MIVNYYSSRKTRKPFCGLACCGNSFGRCDRSCYRHDSRMNRKILMRRYAKRAERILILHEIQNQISEEFLYWQDANDAYAQELCNEMDSSYAYETYEQELKDYVDSRMHTWDEYAHYDSEDI